MVHSFSTSTLFLSLWSHHRELRIRLKGIKMIKSLWQLKVLFSSFRYVFRQNLTSPGESEIWAKRKLDCHLLPMQKKKNNTSLSTAQFLPIYIYITVIHKNELKLRKQTSRESFTSLSRGEYMMNDDNNNRIPYLPLALNLHKRRNEPCRWQPPASVNKGCLLT